MKQKKKKQLTHWLSVIIIGISLGLGLQFVRAWTEPTEAPPGGNVGAPINTGAQMQTKEGGFNVLGFLGIGTNSPTEQIDAVGKIKSRTGFCINDSCIEAWPSGTTTTTTTTTTPPTTPTCPLCGTCGDTSSSLYSCNDGLGVTWNVTQYSVCTTSGWICTSCCGGCGSFPYTCS